MNYFDFMEKKTRGTPDFPLAYYYVDETHPNYEMPFHWHRELEISYILKGSYTFYLNDDVIVAKEGDVVFIESGVIHGGKPDNCIYECIVFNPVPFLPNIESCKKVISNLISPETHIHPYFQSGTHPLCGDTEQLMNTIKTHSEALHLNILVALYRWFYTIYDTESYTLIKKQDIPDEKKMSVLRPVFEYIDKHYMNQITLEQLAVLADMSVSHFVRYFKSLIHKTPIEYLIYYRLERACYFLASGQNSITEIVYMCGFNDISYFISTFKKYKGMTPKQYRKQYL